MAEFNEVISSFVFHPPSIPIIANITARALTDVASIKEDLLKQLRHCIQWQDSIEYMIQNGVTSFYEIGPSMVLSSLTRHTNSEVQTLSISRLEDIAQLKAQG